MSNAKRRLDQLESGLTPKQAMLLWLQEAHAFRGIEEYVRHLKTQPDNAAPWQEASNAWKSCSMRPAMGASNLDSQLTWQD